MANVCALCDHHAKAAKQHSPNSCRTFAQMTLANYSGHLTLSKIPPTPHPRTPAPKAVRNIANQPIFSTNNPTLTTFLRLPPEIRIQIYQLLLKCDYIIQYGICPVSRRFVSRVPQYWRKLRHSTHMLFPSILECCKKISVEGREILYGENLFHMECLGGHCPPTRTWVTAQRNINLMTKLQVSFRQHEWQHPLPGNSVFEVMDRFVGLREVHFGLNNPMLADWEAFLSQANERMRCWKKVVLTFNISDQAGLAIIEWDGRSSLMPEEEKIMKTYGEIFKKYARENRKVRWEYKEADGFSRSHRYLGTMTVFLE